jgi:hypothetical protein
MQVIKWSTKSRSFSKILEQLGGKRDLEKNNNALNTIDYIICSAA